MNPGRRQVLYSLGAAGMGAVSGCLRLTNEATDTTRSQQGETTPGPAAFSVSVVGRQFQWEFSYPTFDLNGRQELVLPVGTSVELAATSEDVVHGFAIDSLGVSLDAMPDDRSETVVTPESTGEFTAVCTEYCGEGHSDMTASVRVVSASEFERWRS